MKSKTLFLLFCLFLTGCNNQLSSSEFDYTVYDYENTNDFTKPLTTSAYIGDFSSLNSDSKALIIALLENYAVGAFNVNNMEILQAVVRAASELNSPLILQASAGARKYAGDIFLRKLVEAAVENSNIPIALHLDHGESFEICKNCIDSGFTSVMIDGSSLEYNKNIE